MTGDLIVETIEVDFKQKPGPPVRFTWRGQSYPIASVLRMWYDHGFGPLAKGRRWWLRRHRTCYLVRTDKGEDFEIYLDRSRSEWILYRKLVHPEAE